MRALTISLSLVLLLFAPLAAAQWWNLFSLGRFTTSTARSPTPRTPGTDKVPIDVPSDVADAHERPSLSPSSSPSNPSSPSADSTATGDGRNVNRGTRQKDKSDTRSAKTGRRLSPLGTQKTNACSDCMSKLLLSYWRENWPLDNARYITEAWTPLKQSKVWLYPRTLRDIEQLTAEALAVHCTTHLRAVAPHLLAGGGVGGGGACKPRHLNQASWRRSYDPDGVFIYSDFTVRPAAGPGRVLVDPAPRGVRAQPLPLPPASAAPLLPPAPAPADEWPFSSSAAAAAAAADEDDWAVGDKVDGPSAPVRDVQERYFGRQKSGRENSLASQQSSPMAGSTASGAKDGAAGDARQTSSSSSLFDKVARYMASQRQQPSKIVPVVLRGGGARGVGGGGASVPRVSPRGLAMVRGVH